MNKEQVYSNLPGIFVLLKTSDVYFKAVGKVITGIYAQRLIIHFMFFFSTKPK